MKLISPIIFLISNRVELESVFTWTAQGFFFSNWNNQTDRSVVHVIPALCLESWCCQIHKEQDGFQIPDFLAWYQIISYKLQTGTEHWKHAHTLLSQAFTYERVIFAAWFMVTFGLRFKAKQIDWFGHFKSSQKYEN